MAQSKLAEARIKTGFTQVKVADTAKVSIRAYQRYESGKRTPDADVAVRIAKALGTNVEALFTKPNQ